MLNMNLMLSGIYPFILFGSKKNKDCTLLPSSPPLEKLLTSGSKAKAFVSAKCLSTALFIFPDGHSVSTEGTYRPV